ncbi:MAG: NUDIX domain-containing protein [Bacteroidales bacterium]
MTSNSFYSHTDRFLVSVDCIVLGFHEKELKILTSRRLLEPEKGKHSLFGGFVFASESITQAARRVLHKLTGIDHLYMEQVGTYGDLNRDPAERVISVAYVALINLEDYDPGLMEEHHAEWLNLEESDLLIFDHKKMVNDSVQLLRKKASAFSVGFNLLPEKFTLTQLQALYEALYSEPLDKRNFRKKVLSLDILNRLEEKDKIHSRKGAYFYTLSDEYQKKLQKENFSFSK